MSRAIFILSVLLLLVVMSCSTTSNEFKTTAGSANEIRTSVEITPISPEKWEVSISVSQPVETLIFDRSTGDHRRGTWQLTSADLSIQQRNDKDVIISKSGKTFTNAVASLTPHRESIEKEYLLFGSFTSGAQRVYTGQFRISAGDRDGKYLDLAGKKLLTFYPGSFKQVFVGDKWHRKPYVVDASDEKTDRYVIYGKIDFSPFEGSDFVVDPGAPDWISEGVRRYMKSASEYLSSRLGPKTGPNTLTLISYEPISESDGISIEGGVLADQVHFHIKGSGLEKPDADLISNLGWIAVHETAHTWNSFGKYTPNYFYDDPNAPDDDAPEAQWLHEGGAEMFTFKAISKNQLASREYLSKTLSRNYNDCTEALGKGALNNAADDGRFRDYYSCGFMIGLLTDASCAAAGLDTEDIWLRMFLKTSDDNRYGQALYYKSLALCPLADSLIKTIDEMTLKGSTDPEAFLESAFRHAGVVVYRDDHTVRFTPSPIDTVE